MGRCNEIDSETTTKSSTREKFKKYLLEIMQGRINRTIHVAFIKQ